MVLWDQGLETQQRLLCKICINNLETNANMMSFQKVNQLIEQNQQNKRLSVNNIITANVKEIEQIQQTILEMKTNFLLQIDQLLGNTNDWIDNLKQIGQESLKYSFSEELEKQIKKIRVQEYNLELLSDKLIQVNLQWHQKIISKLNQLNNFNDNEKCQKLLSRIETINQPFFQGDVQLKLIDDKIKQQNNCCFSIVFNNSGQIMVSNCKEEIKIWSFNNGRFKLLNTFQIHKQNVNCLVYSKYMNNFISCSDDQSIVCWKQITQNNWKWSESYKLHSNSFYHLVLDKQEKQLFSGGHDTTINIWNVDFHNNTLIYIYSLNGHKNGSFCLALNESETILVSCGYTELVYWEKGPKGEQLQHDTKLKDAGWNIKFINNSELLYTQEELHTNEIHVYEKIGQEFKLNQEKSIKLLNNSQHTDNAFSNIAYNKENNIIMVRYKEYFNIIRKNIDGKFKVAGQLKCQTNSIYGGLTNDAKYLIFWDEKQQAYLSYEILNI